MWGGPPGPQPTSPSACAPDLNPHQRVRADPRGPGGPPHSSTGEMVVTFLMAGGGTGGHVIPLLAVARELRSRGQEAFFIGTDRGLEAKLVPAEGFPLEPIEIGGLKRVGARQRLTTGLQLPASTLSLPAAFEIQAHGRGLQHGRLCGRPAGDRGAAQSHPGGGHGAECHSRFHEPAHRPLCLARAIELPRDRGFFSEGQDGDDRTPRARRVLPDSAQAAGDDGHRADYRRQPGLADAEPGGARELAVVSKIPTLDQVSAPDRAQRVRGIARGVRPRRALPAR